MGDNIISNQKIRTEKRPIEGGWDNWGNIIVVGMALPFISALSSMPSFGLMFDDFLMEVGAKTSAVTLITGCFFCAMSFAGLFSNTLFNKFSIRSVGVFGAFLYTLGCFLTIFIKSVEQMLITFSIFQGAGFGFIIPCAYTTFNHYFLERRVVMMSVAQSLIGIGTMIYPLLVQFLMNEYGFRGGMAILAALNAHSIFGMLVMIPIEWNYKSHKIQIIDTNEKEPEVKIVVMSEDNCELTPIVDVEEKFCLSVPKHDDIPNGLNKYLKSPKSERSKSLDPSHGLDGFDPTRRRVSSISSLGNWTGAVLVSEAPDAIKKNGKWYFKQVVDFLDLTLFSDLIYLNMVLGMSFAMYSDTAFFTLQPLYMFELGFSKANTALVIAIGAAADLASRILLAILCLCIKVKARYIFLAGSGFTVIARFVFLYIEDFFGMAIITSVMGFLRTWIHVTLPLVFAEYLSQERFSSGYCLFMFFSGNMSFLLAPLAGFLRDSTESYVICFHSLNFIMALCAVPWLIEITWVEVCGKKRLK